MRERDNRIGRTVAVTVVFGLVALLFTVFRRSFAGSVPSDAKARAIWRRSVTIGVDVPMRAEMTMTQRRHGSTYTTQAHIVQGPHGRYRMEYEAPEDARGRIVFSDSHTNWQYEPARSLLARTVLPVPSVTDDRSLECLIEQNYRIVLVSDRSTVAGRPCFIVDLLPRHAGKSQQRRWIDRATYKTLRLETHYTDGILARMVSYDHVALPAVITDADFLPMQATRIHTVSGPASDAQSSARDLSHGAEALDLRPTAALGFQLIGITEGPLNGSRATQLLYTDGIETISVFVQRADTQIVSAGKGWSELAIKNTRVFQNIDGHLNTLVWSADGKRYTAVTHLVPRALQAVVSSELP